MSSNSTLASSSYHHHHIKKSAFIVPNNTPTKASNANYNLVNALTSKMKELYDQYPKYPFTYSSSTSNETLMNALYDAKLLLNSTTTTMYASYLLIDILSYISQELKIPFFTIGIDSKINDINTELLKEFVEDESHVIVILTMNDTSDINSYKKLVHLHSSLIKKLRFTKFHIHLDFY